MSNEQRKIKDPSVRRCSQNQVKNFVFLKEKDFLSEYLPTLDEYKKKQTRLLRSSKKLPPEMYLRQLQAFREQLLSDVSLLKKKYSKKVTQKYEAPKQNTAKPLSEAERKKQEKQQKMAEQQAKVRKLREEFKGDFDFFKADVQLRDDKGGTQSNCRAAAGILRQESLQNRVRVGVHVFRDGLQGVGNHHQVQQEAIGHFHAPEQYFERKVGDKRVI